MPDYRKSAGGPVEHRPTKYDGFKLVKTEHPYKHQKGSGRSQVFQWAKDGMLIGDWTKECAKHGFESKFVVGSLLKLTGAAKPGWTISEKDANGRTLAEVKKIRDIDPKKKAEREAKAKAAAEAKAKKKAEREAAKAAKAKAKPSGKKEKPKAA